MGQIALRALPRLQLINQFLPNPLRFWHEWFNGCGNVETEEEGGEFVGGEGFEANRTYPTLARR